jgi:hypothetical protein
VISAKRGWQLFAVIASLTPLVGGCNQILGIERHTLAPGGAGGTTGSGGAVGTGGGSGTTGAAGGPVCSNDDGGSATDADQADAGPMTCGFVMPNPFHAPGDLPNRASYTKYPASHTVMDNVTGLTWEAEVDPTTAYTQQDAIMHCQNKSGGGWRLPTRLELVSLVDFTVAQPGPTIAPEFGNDPAWTAVPDVNGDYRKFWTSGHAAFDPNTGWEVDFSNGSTHQKLGTGFYRARCVSGTPCRCASPRYQIQASPSGDLVHDATTGLTWQRTVPDQKMVWMAATTYCPAGWRLPTPAEIATIVDETAESPSIDMLTFPGTPGEPFWTSLAQAVSADAGTSTFAWYLTFLHGHSDVYPSNDPVNSWWVRCVRWDGP